MEELKDVMDVEMLETVGDTCTEVCDNFCEEICNESKLGRNVMVGFVGASITAVGAVAIAKRDKIREWNEERMVRKLEKKGYDVRRPIESEYDVEEDVD